MIHDAFKKGNPLTNATFSLNVSFGTSKSYSRMESTTREYAGSRIASGGNTNVTAGERDLTVTGSAITGRDVSLTAKGNVRLEAGENTSITTTENKFSSASIGASFTPQGLSNISVNASKGNGNSKENLTAYSPTLVSAANNLSLTSGKDMDIIGSRAQGDKITAKVSGNLNIETLQEKEIYEEQNKSAGFGVSWSMNPVTQRLSKPTFGRDWSKGTIDSDYRSARDQAGFFAGSKGFDIYVKKNTDLKGGLIASEASSDKNKLSTGTFSFSDLHNEAEYRAKDTGSSAQIKPTLVQTKKEDPEGNKEKTLKVVQALHSTPSIPTVVQGSADSTTKAAVAPGIIDIRENPTQDISALSRNTANALNELGRIFDKKSVEEQKELVNVFREEAFRLLHNLPDDGSGRKVLLHSIVGGLISQFAGAGFASGAAGAGLNEALINNLKGLDPAIAQIVSGLLGAAAAKIVNGDATAGATAAASGTKHNFFGGAAATSMSPQIMAALTGYMIVVYAGVQYIQNTATNEIVAQLQQDGNWLLNNVDSTLESVFKEHNIPYSQPQTLNGPHYYITPPITVNPPDHEHFPFDLSPNILDLKYKPYTNPLFDFKEQWSSQDFSDGNRFFSKGVEKEKADKAYPPANEHSSTNNPKDFERTGKPNSSIDRVDEKGRIITRRWYDGNGRAKKDVDFTDHGNPKTHPEVPHEHTWEWDKNGNASRK